jgi:CheY-like chemotaxis protein
MSALARVLLVVDDDPDVLRAVSREVRRALDGLEARAPGCAARDIEVVGADTWQAALLHVTRDDLVGCVLDLRLGSDAPREGGLVLADVALRRDPRVPVVILTGQDPAVVGDSPGRRLIPCVYKGSLPKPLHDFVEQVVRHTASRDGRRVFADDVGLATVKGRLNEGQLAYLVAHARVISTRRSPTINGSRLAR